jgi:hypothetical protein
LAREKEKLTSQSVWTCCLVAFWGAFRLGELLEKSEKIFDKFSDLLWGDIKFGKSDEAVLFSIPDPGYCPVVALAL